MKTPNTDVPTTPTQTFPDDRVRAVELDECRVHDRRLVYLREHQRDDQLRQGVQLDALIVGGRSYANIVLLINRGAACTFANSNNDTIAIKGNLAIISDWGFDLSSSSNWNGMAGIDEEDVLHQHGAGCRAAPRAAPRTRTSSSGTTRPSTRSRTSSSTRPCSADMANQNTLLRPGARDERHDPEQLHDDVHARARAGLGNGHVVPAGHLVRARGALELTRLQGGVVTPG